MTLYADCFEGKVIYVAEYASCFVTRRRVSASGPISGGVLSRQFFQKDFETTKYHKIVSPFENDYIKPFDGKLRDELLAIEIFYSLKKAQIIIKQ